MWATESWLQLEEQGAALAHEGFVFIKRNEQNDQTDTLACLHTQIHSKTGGILLSECDSAGLVPGPVVSSVAPRPNESASCEIIQRAGDDKLSQVCAGSCNKQ